VSFIRTVSSIRWWTSVLCSHSRPVKVCLQHMNWTGKYELKYGHTCSSIFSMNNRSFLPRLWSKLLASVRQPRINLSNSDSPLSVALPPSVPSTHHPHHPLFPHSSIPGLKPTFSANPSHRMLPFLLRHGLRGFPRLFTDTFELIRFYRAMLSIRGTSHGPVSVRLSVTSRCSIEMVERIELVLACELPSTRPTLC